MQKLLTILCCTSLLLACQPSGQSQLPPPSQSNATATTTARTAKIMINGPQETATLLDNQTLFLDYEIIDPPAPLRATFSLDGKLITTLYAPKGSHPLGKLKANTHLVKIELLGADGKPSGVSASRFLTVRAAPEE